MEKGMCGWIWGGALILLCACGGSQPPPERNWGREMGERLRGRIGKGTLLIGGHRLPASPALSRFYARRGNRPAWCGPRGPLAQADDLVQALRQVEEDGLDPGEYRLEMLELRLAEWRGTASTDRGLSPNGLAELDLLLTDAFLRCGADLQRGRTEARQIYPEWQARTRPADLAGLLLTALDLNQVEEALLGLRPPQVGYYRLRRGLAGYRALAVDGSWEELPDCRGLRSGAQGRRVRALSRRLAACGDLLGAGGVKERFDLEMEQALVRFQLRHGLEGSGWVDAESWKALQVPLAQRIAQIELNMERWRWLPHDPGTRYILVRIADFALDVVESGRPVIQMRVIVGRPFWRTPIFSAMMTRLEFNPYWYIPSSIAVDEVLPAVQRDSTFLEERQIRVAVGRGDTARVVNADSIDWQGMKAEDFDLLFTQLPGSANPLGRVKFYMPNPFDVYLHDTPNSALFAQRIRDFSHGCIRLEKSRELAAYLLGGGWDVARVDEAIASDENRVLVLPEPIPVYLLYWTAWVDEGGEVQFREDWYDGDEKLQMALSGRAAE